MSTKIKLLSSTTINRIAAGEVVERPASVVKELVENAIDAKANSIDIIINQAGRNLITVIDNGQGMSKADLALAVLRHTTSKLNEDNIQEIKFFGFRGEALPSIASVSRLTITSREQNQDLAWSLKVIGGKQQDIIPAALKVGTKIEVRDLFFATPARLKFLKSERTELLNIIEIINKLIMAHPEISFSLKNESRTIIKTQLNNKELLPNNNLRINEIFGREFANNSFLIELVDNDIIIFGYGSLPSLSRKTSTDQYVFVNNRPVRDKLIMASIKIAYQDVLINNRYPVIALFINIPSELVDVNVHPTKAEVRFQNSNYIKNIIVTAIRNGIDKANETNTINKIELTNPIKFNSTDKPNPYLSEKYFDWQKPQKMPLYFNNREITHHKLDDLESKQEYLLKKSSEDAHLLGTTIAKIDNLYILTKTKDKLLIINYQLIEQELAYLELKQQINSNLLLTYDTDQQQKIKLTKQQIHRLLINKQELSDVGIIINIDSEDNLVIISLPELIQNIETKKFIDELIDELTKNINSTISESRSSLLRFITRNLSQLTRDYSFEQINKDLREFENLTNIKSLDKSTELLIELTLNSVEELFHLKNNE